MKAIIVANWKMNPETLAEAKKLFTATKKEADAATAVKIIVAPPNLFLGSLKRSYKGKRIAFASQVAHWEDQGSYTGDESVPMVKGEGATHLIVGHAERRRAGVNNEDVQRKVAAAIKHKVTPIICIGEDERDDRGHYLRVVREQLLSALKSVPKNALKNILIAYEPVWAIGAKEPMSSHEMHQMSLYIRKVLGENYGPIGMTTKVLYGGSVTADTAVEMIREGEVDGLLVGRVSIDAKKMSDLVRAIAGPKKK